MKISLSLPSSRFLFSTFLDIHWSFLGWSFFLNPHSLNFLEYSDALYDRKQRRQSGVWNLPSLPSVFSLHVADNFIATFVLLNVQSFNLTLIVIPSWIGHLDWLEGSLIMKKVEQEIPKGGLAMAFVGKIWTMILWSFFSFLPTPAACQPCLAVFSM